MKVQKYLYSLKTTQNKTKARIIIINPHYYITNILYNSSFSEKYSKINTSQ